MHDLVPLQMKHGLVLLPWLARAADVPCYFHQPGQAVLAGLVERTRVVPFVDEGKSSAVAARWFDRAGAVVAMDLELATVVVDVVVVVADAAVVDAAAVVANADDPKHLKRMARSTLQQQAMDKPKKVWAHYDYDGAS